MSGQRAKAKRKAARSVTTAAGRPRGRAWTLTGGAVDARAARITTAEHLHIAAIARLIQVDRLRACQLQAAHLGNPKAAIATVFGGMGYQPPYPTDLERAAEMVVADEARYLAGAELYVLTPQMCDVVVAARPGGCYAVPASVPDWARSGRTNSVTRSRARCWMPRTATW